MAQRYDNGLMVEKDLKQSFRYVKSAAEKGYTYAQAMLGIYLLEGTGTNIDIGQSIKYLQYAQEKDEFFSYALARAYEVEGPYQNFKKAYELFFAFKANWKIGLYNELGLIEPSSLLTAKEAYEKASQNGVVDAKVRLAVWKFFGIETIEDIESASKELYPFWDRVDIKEILMIEHYEKVFTENLGKLDNVPSNEIASASLNCAQQCLRAYPHFNVKNNYGIEVRNKILLRGINWFINSFNLPGYSAIDNFYKKQFFNSISTEVEQLVGFHEAGLITTKTLYIFARQFRLTDLDSIAIPIYEKLANLGFGVPQYILGISYAQGVFKPQNYLKSYAWLNLASSNGIEIALQNREKVASQIAQSEIILGQKLAEEIQFSIDSVKVSLGLYDEIREIEKAELEDINSPFATKFSSFFSEKEEGFKARKKRVRKPFKKASFQSPSFIPDKDSVTEKKSAPNSIFGTIVKVLLFLPFAALFAWIIYMVAAIALVWIFVKLGI